MFYMQIRKDGSFNQPVVFEKQYKEGDEWDIVNSALQQNIPRAGFFKAAVIPIRTDSISNFCKDFFLPNVVNQSIVFIIHSLVIDILTFPIRVLTAIPRYYFNLKHTREIHPLHEYLTQQKMDSELLKVDHLYVEITEKHPINVSIKISGTTFNFISLPEGVSSPCKGIKVFEKPNLAQTELLGLPSSFSVGEDYSDIPKEIDVD
jgi:hypothetical protein